MYNFQLEDLWIQHMDYEFKVIVRGIKSKIIANNYEPIRSTRFSYTHECETHDISCIVNYFKVFRRI